MAVDPYQTFLDTLAVSEGDFEDRLTKLAELGVRHQEAAWRKNYYKDLELDGIGGSLDTLIGVIDNPEGVKEAEYQLAAYRGEAGSNVEHKINAMALQNKLERTSPKIAPLQCPTCKGPVGLADTNSMLYFCCELLFDP